MRKSFTRLFLFVFAIALFFNSSAQAMNRPNSLTPDVAKVVLSPSSSIFSAVFMDQTNAITNLEVSAVKKNLASDSNIMMQNAIAVVQKWRGETTHILKHPTITCDVNYFAVNTIGASDTRADYTLELRSKMPRMEDLGVKKCFSFENMTTGTTSYT